MSFRALLADPGPARFAALKRRTARSRFEWLEKHKEPVHRRLHRPSKTASPRLSTNAPCVQPQPTITRLTSAHVCERSSAASCRVLRPQTLKATQVSLIKAAPP